MKRFLIGGLMLAVSAVGFAQTYYVTGDYIVPAGGFQSGDWATPGNAGTTQLSLNSGTGFYEATLSNLVVGDVYEYKIFDVPSTPTFDFGFGSNTKVKATSTSMKVVFTPTAPGDGYLPSSGHRTGYDMAGVETLEVIGSWDGFAGTTTYALNQVSPGLYETNWIAAGVFSPNTSYNFKFRTPGTWSQTNIGAGLGVDNNISFTTNADWTVTKFIYNPSQGRLAMVPEPASMAALGLGLLGLARRRRNK